MEINHVLGELYNLLAADRISPRRGAVMAYTCSLLLCTLPAIDDELDLSDEPQPFIFDLPRPKCDDDISPERLREPHVRTPRSCLQSCPPDTCNGWPPNPEQSK